MAIFRAGESINYFKIAPKVRFFLKMKFCQKTFQMKKRDDFCHSGHKMYICRRRHF